MATCIDSKVGEYQVATAAEPSRSASETDEDVKSWTDHDHHVDYAEEAFDRSKRHDCLMKYSNNDNNVTHRVQNDEELSHEEKRNKLSKRKLCDNVTSDRKKDNKTCNDQEGIFESVLSNQEKVKEYKKAIKRNYTSETVLDNEYCDERKTRAARAIKVPIAPANNHISNPSESAYFSQDADKAIDGSNKRERVGDVETRKDDYYENEAEPMEISSPRSHAYPRDIVVRAATSSTDSHREVLRGEATRKIVRAKDNDARSSGKTQRSASARNPGTDRADSRTPETDIVVLSSDCAEERKRDNARKCENCGESHFPYGRYSHLWKYSGYLNRDAADYKATNRDVEARIVADRGTDSGRLAAPTAVLYRSRSLPRLSVHDSGVACSDHGPVAAPKRTASRQLVADLRQLLTLKQHYYPEGGWGWVVLLVGLLVQILSHGAHGSVGVFLEQVAVKFGPHVHLQAAIDWIALSSNFMYARYAAHYTIKQHYYPENGWGWVIVVTGVMVQILATGIHGAAGAWLLLDGTKRYRQTLLNVGWLGAMSTGVALLVSPVTIAFCRRKSTRVTAVLGGLVTALGCLFTSFASQFHQLFFSYGTVVGIGVGMTRDCSTLMVAQYFKRKRELVEIFIVSGSGLGIAVMSAFIKGAISKIGWRLGLQAVTGVVFLTFILGTFYRSASLYHPQRRAILHLKNQKRKIKDKNKTDDRPPFFDFSTLRSKTVRILLVSTGISAFGINTPIFYLAHQVEEEGLGDTVVLLQAYLGLAWTVGCVAFGLLVVHRNVECRIARQYLTQAAVFVCGLCILALTAVQGNYHGYVMFAWIYGIFCGGYHYSLKMYTYERVRARNFARTWGFVQCSQAIPIAIGVPISGYINVGCGGKAGYYFSSTCVLVGSFTLFFIDLHRRNLSKHKHKANGTKHICASDSCPQRRRPSFSQEPDNEGSHVAAAGAAGATAAALVLGADIAPAQGEAIDALGTDKPELTCISEEGIADMDLPDNLLEDLDYIGDCITSCNKVENYLMLSEFENNLIAEMPIIMDRRGRRWSLARSKTNQSNCGQNSGMQSTTDDEEVKSKWRFTNVPSNSNTRMITVIDEASA